MKKLTLSTAILATLSSLSLGVKASDTLDNIFVTANNSAQPLKTVTSSTFVVTQQELEDRQVQTLQQALQKIPGLNFYNNGGPLQGTSIQMRGSSSGQVLVMVDGISINDPSGFGANLNSVALQDVERIEVIKGPQAGVWGVNAASGVINIITKQAKYGENGQVNVEVGSNQTRKLAASLSSANQQGDFAFSASTVSSDGFSAVVPNNGEANEGENDQYSQTDFTLKFGFNLAKQHRLETLVKNSTTSADYDSGFPIDANDDIANSEVVSELRRLQYRFNQDNLNVRVYLSQFEIERTLTQPSNIGLYEGKVTEQGAIANFEYLKDQSLTAGLIQKDTSGSSDFFGVSRADYESTSLFASNTNQFNKGKLVLTQSLRKDSFDNYFDDKLTGKIGFKNFFNNNVYLGANYGTAYNAPSLFEQTNQVAGNPLQPETTEGYEVNLGAYGLEVSYYHNEVADLLAYDMTNFGYFNESGTSTLKGLEISYARFFKSLNTDLYVAYDVLSAKNSDNQWLGRRPESQASLNLTYSGLSKLLLGFETQYIGKMYDRNNQQGAKIGDYALANLSISYAANKQLDLYARVNNAFDTQTVSAVANYENNFDITTPVQDIYNNGGRQFFIGLRGKL